MYEEAKPSQKSMINLVRNIIMNNYHFSPYVNYSANESHCVIREQWRYGHLSQFREDVAVQT